MKAEVLITEKWKQREIYIYVANPIYTRASLSRQQNLMKTLESLANKYDDFLNLRIMLYWQFTFTCRNFYVQYLTYILGR